MKCKTTCVTVDDLHEGLKDVCVEKDGVFEEGFEEFKRSSRTYQVLTLLEEKSELTVDEEADDLLPSIDLLVGYNVKGTSLEIEDEDNMVYFNLSKNKIKY